MPTRTLGIKATENLNQVSRCTSRVPLEALQMLTQSVSKCNQDYIQPLPFKVLHGRTDISKYQTKIHKLARYNHPTLEMPH